MRKITLRYTRYIRESSDGLLHKTTQTALPGALPLYAEEANHLEQTKHENVRDRLYQIFNGELIKTYPHYQKQLEYFKLKK